ncbi:O-fucosyltransferase family protein [Confluentibacter lentus]|uniref:hypothetical protein n=1 Tax=Confluentibacter lentus TaxID=1699412 RepID=UPI000C283A09|nr:hypothetical protein [Confluentibacter lentus]
MKYLYYKTLVKHGEGLSDRRSCLMLLLAEAKLSNRIAVIPKFKLGSQFNNGKNIETYMVNEYFNIDKLNVNYIFEENFYEIEKNISQNDILNIKDKGFAYDCDKILVIRNLENDSFWSLKNLNVNVISLAKLYHGVGVKFIIPLVAPTEKIKNIGDEILNQLEKPVIGLHLRRTDRLNKKLDESMGEKTIINKLNNFKYNSVFYCSNDQNYKINNNKFYSNNDFKDTLQFVKDNYLLFCIEMYVVDNCDISVRTFNDSSPFYFIDNKTNKNYSICDYSMHGSNNRFKNIPKKLNKCDYEDYNKENRKTFTKRRSIILRVIKLFERKIKNFTS